MNCRAVWGDPTALEQVFANLIGNAVNYLDPPREGRIEIGTTPAPPGVHSLRIFYVRDNGLGIPAVALPRLFNAFQRLHGNVAAGEGIGLALVRRVVERHGGRVWAESREGVGTTFYLSLPEAEARIAQQAVGTQAPLAVASVQTIRDARPAGWKLAIERVEVAALRMQPMPSPASVRRSRYAVKRRRGLSILLPRIDQ